MTWHGIAEEDSRPGLFQGLVDEQANMWFVLLQILASLSAFSLTELAPFTIDVLPLLIKQFCQTFEGVDLHEIC